MKTMQVTTILTLMIFSFAGCSKAPDSVSPSSVSPAIKYEKKLIRRPGTTPEDGKVYVVLNGQRHWIWAGEWIRKNGMKFPDDVNEIPASELDSIPLADAIP